MSNWGNLSITHVEKAQAGVSMDFKLSVSQLRDVLAKILMRF